MRGYTHSIQALAKPIAFVCMEKEIDVVIIDPIYKVLSGDENSAGEIGRVCNTLDWIAQEGDCAVIFSHHHSKGVKGNKQVLDRSSGSGVFGRDPEPDTAGSIRGSTGTYGRKADDRLADRSCAAGISGDRADQLLVPVSNPHPGYGRPAG